MAKNNKLINSLLKISQRNRADNQMIEAEIVIPIIYAGVALALHDQYGWGHKRINRAFVYSQDLWTQLNDGEFSKETMLEWCYERTGIRLMSPSQAKEEGIDANT